MSVFRHYDDLNIICFVSTYSDLICVMCTHMFYVSTCVCVCSTRRPYFLVDYDNDDTEELERDELQR